MAAQFNQQPYFESSNAVDMSAASLPLDDVWARNAFMIGNNFLNFNNLNTNELNTTNLQNFSTNNPALYYRFWSSAYLKFTNTQIGGNIGVNPKPQFTRYADIRIPGLVYNNPVTIYSKNAKNMINVGMGRYYSEAIDDKAQRAYFRFGVPMFNTLTSFLSNMFNSDMADLANTGRSPGSFYVIGKVIGTVVSFGLFPFASTLLTTAEIVTRAITSKSVSTFYTMKPTMPLYWSAVNDLVNELATYRGILPPAMLSNTPIGPMAPNSGVSASDISIYHDLLPNVFTSEGALNVYAFANKTQMMYDAAHKALKNQEKNQSASSITPQTYSNVVTKAVKGAANNATPSALNTLIKKWKSSGLGVVSTIKKGVNEAESFFMYSSSKIKSTTGSDKSDPYMTKSKAKGFTDYFQAEASAGGGYAVFIVEDTGSQSESFSNEVGESGVESMLNNITTQARAVTFDFSDGNILPGVGSLVSSLKDTIQGAASGFHLSGIVNMLFGMGYVSVPKYWTGSSASLPRVSYKMDLISPYGNPISQLQNIYVPFIMLLVGALPLATGKQSYTSPFICQVFDRGKAQIQLGIIDSLDITRGVTNLKYTQEWRMLGMEVTVSVADLSQIMFVPLTKGTFFNIMGKASKILAGYVGNTTNKFVAGLSGSLALAATDENGVLYDYLMTVAGASAQDSLYYVSKAKLELANDIKYDSELTSPAFWANKFYGMASSMFGVGILTKMYAGYSVNAELATPAQAATKTYITQNTTLSSL